MGRAGADSRVHNGAPVRPIAWRAGGPWLYGRRLSGGIGGDVMLQVCQLADSGASAVAAEALAVGVLTRRSRGVCASITGEAECWTRREPGKGVYFVIAGEHSACDNLDCLTIHDRTA